jgi:8-oxo-dGTP diphosphatase
MKQLVVGAVIVDNLDAPSRIIAARRSDPEALRGKWEFPGGKVEDGEGPEDALVRELKEELGIGIVLGGELLAPEDSVWRISEELEMRLWFVVIVEGVPTPFDSHDQVRWLNSDSLESVDWLEADRQVLPLLLRHLSRGPG